MVHVKLLHAWWWIKRFLLERRHVLRPWTGTRGVAEGAAGPIDYLHPFLNQMLDYENKGLVRNESPEERKGLEREGGLGRVSMPVYAYCRPAKTPCEGCLEYQPRVVAQVHMSQHSPVLNEILFQRMVRNILFFLIYISRNTKN